MCVFNMQCKSAQTRAKATKPNLNKGRGNWITIGFMSVVLCNSLTLKSRCDRDLELPTIPGGWGLKECDQTLCSSVHFSSVVQSLSRRLFETPWTAARQASLSITNSQSLLKFMSIESVMPSNHLILYRPLLLLLAIFPSIRVFSNYSVLCIRWPKYWSFNFSISSSNGYSGLISFWANWFDLLAIQKTLKSLHQHHSSKASILQHSAFFTVQLSDPYMTTGKTIALTKQTFVGKVMSLLFNMLSRLVIASLPRSFSSKSKCLLMSWLQSPSAVILEPNKIVCHYAECLYADCWAFPVSNWVYIFPSDKTGFYKCPRKCPVSANRLGNCAYIYIKNIFF